MPLLEEETLKETRHKETKESPSTFVGDILGYLDSLPETVLVLYYPRTRDYLFTEIEGTKVGALVASEDAAILEVFQESFDRRMGRGQSKVVRVTIGTAREIVRSMNAKDRKTTALVIFDGPDWKQVRIDYVC